jgi:hypothetical protein
MTLVAGRPVVEVGPAGDGDGDRRYRERRGDGHEQSSDQVSLIRHTKSS